MKMIKVSCVFICIIVLLSCDSNGKLKQGIKQLQAQPIDLCLDSLYYYVDSSCKVSSADSASFYESHMALVVYSDSTACSPCAIKSLYRWFEVLDTVQARYGNGLKTYFIFSPPKEQIYKLQYAIHSTLFDYPVFIDTAYVFSKHNPHLPANKLLHTFLLDKDCNVRLVGCPLRNHSIHKLFYEIADKNLLYN